ncbi:MAG: hypothetical protein GY868_02885, partial [Deltaproteobacteria bacterium]|nr:hypothetical protein [Deltaproteobacteria bacterium]
MKRKQSILFTVCAVPAVVTATALYAFLFFEGPLPQRAPLQRLPEIAVPAAAEIAEIQKLENRLALLANPPRTVIDHKFQLNLFDHLQTYESACKIDGKSRNTTDYTLSLVMQSDKKRLCIINGSVYPEGSTLPDGSRVVTVEPQRVLV